MRFCIRHGNPVFLHSAVGSDQRRRANRPLNGLALGILPRPPGAVSFHNLHLRVREQGERQVELGDELIMRLDAVSAHTQNHRIGLRYRLNSVAEPARFFGSTGCIVLGVKPKNDVFSGVIGKRMLFAIAPQQRKGRCLLPF
jgi:hypothetical protein